MPSIVDLVHQVPGLIAYYPCLSDNPEVDAMGVGDDIVMTGTTTGAGPLSDTVVQTSTTSTFSIPNFSDLYDGTSSFGMFGHFYVDAIDAGTHRQMMQMYFAGDAVTSIYSNLNASLATMRWYVRSVSTDGTSFGGPVFFTAATWGSSTFSAIASELDRFRHEHPTASYVNTGAYSSDTFDWGTGKSLYIYEGTSKTVAGRLSHLAFYNRALVTGDKALLDTATTSGSWCMVDLSASGVYKIDDTTQTTATWDYWLYNDTTESICYKQGTDFTLGSGESTNVFFVPAAGDYFLVLRDPSSGKAHAQTVPLIGA